MTTKTQPSPPGTNLELLADKFAPRHEVMQTQHLVAVAPIEATYTALRGLDFTDIGGAIVDAAFWVRGLPERWKNRHHKTTRVPTRLTFDDMAAGSEWVILGERPGEEIAAGAVGRFWKPVIEWRHVDADAFTEFAEPGYGKIVMSLSVRPYGGERSLLTYDIRVILNDSASRAKFRPYWAVVAPFVKVVQATTLRTIARTAEQRDVQ